MVPFSRFEAKTLLKLTGPIMLAQLTQTMMYFVDTVMAGRFSATDMAALAVASGLWLPVVLTMQGLLLALTPIVAQYFGSRQTEPVSHFTACRLIVYPDAVCRYSDSHAGYGAGASR
jgi:multidrug resistance protein, MATE family